MARPDPLSSVPRDLPLVLVALDEPLVRAVQRHLCRPGLLDPPGDGWLGPVTIWALRAFCSLAGLSFENTLSR